MSIVAHSRPFVIGVDAHARNHVLDILPLPNGYFIVDKQFPETAAGLERAIACVARRTGADLDTLWVIEGVGTYGAQIARAAADAGYSVAEAARMNARANRGVGKSDPLDARRIAQAVLPLEEGQLRRPRGDDGVRAALRVLIASRDHISTERTAAINALIALLRVVDLGVDARSTLNGGQIATIAAWRRRTEELATGIARAEAVRLAKRIRAANDELSAITHQMTALIKESPAAGLLDQPGIGPVTAAIAFAAWSHPGRVRSEAAFASLAGVNPIPGAPTRLGPRLPQPHQLHRPIAPRGRRLPAAATPSIVKSQIGLIEARGHDRERVRQLHLRDALLELAIQTLSKSYRPRSEGHSPYPTPLHRLNRSVDRG